MFSRDKAIHPSEEQFPDVSIFIDSAFEKFMHESVLCAGFLCLWDSDNSDLTPVSTYDIPIAPFKGSRKDSLKVYIQDCLNLHPAPHIHSITKYQLWTEVSTLINNSDWQPKALFIPSFIGDLEFVIIGFSKSQRPLGLTDEVIKNACDVIQVAGFILSAASLKSKVNTMEIYVREIGHDIASSVQTIIAKLRNISRGFIEGPAIIEKIREAEEEIMATYRVADTLGITVDPDYNIGNGDDFNAIDSINEVVKLCKSEAAERHIELRIEYPNDNMTLWGDFKAIQSAIMQILLNAIKYAKGSSFITIRLSETYDNVEFSITDVGMSLNEDDVLHIWDFGWRGDRAKELHVNGSGIGLFTVKKIVKAHGGSVNVRISGHHNEIVTFLFRIPKKHILNKYIIGVKGGQQS